MQRRRTSRGCWAAHVASARGIEEKITYTINIGEGGSGYGSSDTGPRSYQRDFGIILFYHRRV